MYWQLHCYIASAYIDSDLGKHWCIWFEQMFQVVLARAQVFSDRYTSTANMLSLHRVMNKDLCCVVFGMQSGRVTWQLNVAQLYAWQSWTFGIPVQTSCHSCASHCPTWECGLQILGHKLCQSVLKPKIPPTADLNRLKCLRWWVIIRVMTRGSAHRAASSQQASRLQPC